MVWQIQEINRGNSTIVTFTHATPDAKITNIAFSIENTQRVSMRITSSFMGTDELVQTLAQLDVLINARRTPTYGTLEIPALTDLNFVLHIPRVIGNTMQDDLSEVVDYLTQRLQILPEQNYVIPFRFSSSFRAHPRFESFTYENTNPIAPIRKVIVSTTNVHTPNGYAINIEFNQGAAPGRNNETIFVNNVNHAFVYLDQLAATADSFISLLRMHIVYLMEPAEAPKRERFDFTAEPRDLRRVRLSEGRELAGTEGEDKRPYDSSDDEEDIKRHRILEPESDSEDDVDERKRERDVAAGESAAEGAKRRTPFTTEVDDDLDQMNLNDGAPAPKKQEQNKPQ